MKFSTSKIKCYKGCKMLYWLRYIEKIDYTGDKAEALVDGTNYHAILENLYNNGVLDLNIQEQPKISAMATAYYKYIYPQFKVYKAEQSFEIQLADNVVLNGRFDGIASDGCIVEHKTTSSDIDEQYIYNLQWDEQVLNYMVAKNMDTIYYTVCKKPLLRQKVNETAQEYYDRIVQWYSEDTDKKIRLIKVVRSLDEIEHQKKALIQLASVMDKEEAIELNKDNYDLIYYRNPQHCQQYGRQCDFAEICLDYKSDVEYINFKKRETKEE